MTFIRRRFWRAVSCMLSECCLPIGILSGCSIDACYAFSPKSTNGMLSRSNKAYPANQSVGSGDGDTTSEAQSKPGRKL
jgi:hypothetical protein